MYSRIIEEIVLAIEQMHGFVDHRQIVYHIASTFLLIGMHCLWKIYVPMQIQCKRPSEWPCIQGVTAQRVKCAIFQIHAVKTWRLDMPIVRSSHKGQTILCRQYHIVIENSNHSLYTEKNMI